MSNFITIPYCTMPATFISSLIETHLATRTHRTFLHWTEVDGSRVTSFQQYCYYIALILSISCPFCSGQPVAIVAFVGDETDLVCFGSSSSPSSWTFDGSTLETVEGITYKIGTFTLTLQNIHHNAQGIYECLNSGKQVIKSFNLTVVGQYSISNALVSLFAYLCMCMLLHIQIS